MDWPHVHLMINHFPVILTVVGTAVLLLAFLRPRRGIWLHAAATLTLAGLSAYPTFFSGDEAADVMKHKWYVVPDMIQAHDNAASITVWVLLVMGGFAAYAWWRMTRASTTTLPPKWLRLVVLLLALGGTGAVAYTAYLGGRIVYDSPKLAAPPSGAAGVATPPM